jgi:hypothetical protein
MRGLLPAAIAALMIGACVSDPIDPAAGALGQEPVGCTMEGWPSVLVQLSDERGAPAAWGATLILRDGAFADTVTHPWTPDGGSIGAGNRRPGTFTATLSKPGYHALVIPGIHVPAGPCGATHMVTVQGTIRLRADAPPVRSIYVVHPSIGFGGPDHTLQLVAHVDADPGISRAVSWASSDTTVATVTAAGLLRSKCRQQTGSAVITARSVADPAVTGAAHVTVWPPYGWSCTP